MSNLIFNDILSFCRAQLIHILIYGKSYQLFIADRF